MDLNFGIKSEFWVMTDPNRTSKKSGPGQKAADDNFSVLN